MKKVSFLAAALVVSIWSFGQGKSVKLGLKGGLNRASLGDERYNVTGPRTGYHLGAFAHIHVLRNFAIQPEVVYSKQGAEYGENTAKLDYVNIPVVGQYMIGNGFRLETGPQLGFLTDGKAEQNNGTETSIKSSLNNLDFSWAFGTGYVSRSGLGLGVRYNLGLSNINETETYDDNNRVWQFSIFYQFRK